MKGSLDLRLRSATLFRQPPTYTIDTQDQLGGVTADRLSLVVDSVAGLAVA